MTDLHSLAATAVELFRQHSPWLAEKVGAAALAQPVREIWDQLKKKLVSPGGQEAIQKVESQPEKDRNWDTLRNHLLDALEEDAEFREQVAGLLGSQGVQQSIVGDGNTQVGIIGSPDASVKVR